MSDISVVVATLFEPCTLERLECQAEAADLEFIVVKDMTVNDAWRHGIEKASNDMIAVLNDDIEVNDIFFDSVAQLVDEGFSYITPLHMRRFAPMPHVIDVEPIHRGHAFVFNRSMAPPIPEAFKVFYGDTWYYNCFKYRAGGKMAFSGTPQYKTGRDVFAVDYFSGWTSQHDGFDEVFARINNGTSYEDQTTLDHEAATELFEMEMTGAEGGDAGFSYGVGAPIYQGVIES